MGTEVKKYRVILHFMEPNQARKGDRIFDVLINGKRILSELDIIRETGVPNRALVKEVNEISPPDTVDMSLQSVSGKPPLLCGVEIIVE